MEDFDLGEVGVGSVTPGERGFDGFREGFVRITDGGGGDGDDFEGFGGDEVPSGVDVG